jgi:dolichol kinase
VELSDKGGTWKIDRQELKMALAREEIRRKLLHLFALLMPIAIFYAPVLSLPRLLVPGILFLLFTASIIVEILRFKVPAIQKTVLTLFGSMMRKEEHAIVSGWTWVIGAAFLCCVLFSSRPYVSFIALTLFIIGDALAALVGISIGRIKIGKKTLEGSIACLIICVLLFYTVFPFVPGLMNAWGGDRFPAFIIWITSFFVTLFELIPLKITPRITVNDNIAVPVIAGYIIIALEKLFL